MKPEESRDWVDAEDPPNQQKMTKYPFKIY